MTSTPTSSNVESIHKDGDELLSVEYGVNEPKDMYGVSPFLRACGERDVNVVRSMIERGADVNDACREGFTGLMRVKNPEIALLLLQNDADSSKRTIFGHTALDIATGFGMCDVVEAFLKGGVDPSRVNSSGETCIERLLDEREHYRKQNHSTRTQDRIISLLMSYGAKDDTVHIVSQETIDTLHSRVELLEAELERVKVLIQKLIPDNISLDV